MKIELNFFFFNFNNNYFATQIKLIFCLNYFKKKYHKNKIKTTPHCRLRNEKTNSDHP